MELFSGFLNGVNISLQGSNLLYCFIGVLIGTVVGVLPGLGPTVAISILLPVTFRIDAIGAIIMLAGIYYGAMYGGSITSILINIPGEAASVVTTLDGYQMARRGRAGVALGISAMGSFIGGTLSLIGLMFLAPPLAELVFKFGPPEYFSLVILGLVMVIFLSSGSTSKALLMAAFGLFLACMGLDNERGNIRFTFGSNVLLGGVNLVSVIMGIYGVAEVLENIGKPMQREIYKTSIRNLLPTIEDWFDSGWAIFRGCVVGFFLGIIPGGGATIASFASYALEKRVTKRPEIFGKGAIQGVAGPETANNAAATGAFIPLLSLGIPANPAMAVLLGALIIHGIRPGPLMITQHGDLFWGVLASMYIGNIMLLFLNLPLIGIWVRLLRVPYKILFPLILALCMIGSYTLKNSTSDVYIMICFGIIGYYFRRFKYDAPPLILALVLAPLAETSLTQSLIISNGSPLIFFQRPISGALLILAFLLLGSAFIPSIKMKRGEMADQSG